MGESIWKHRYDLRKACGLCVRCGADLDGSQGVQCVRCADIVNQRTQNYKLQLEAEGRCIQCAKDRGESRSRVVCQPCLDLQNARNRARRKEARHA